MPEHDVEAGVRALGQIIRRRSTLAALREDPEAALRSLGLEGENLRAMLSLGVERLLAYDAMAVNRLRNNITEFCPATAARLGSRFESEVRTWLDECGPRSPYIRDIPTEFVQWAQARWSADDSLPSWLGELAAFELLDFAVRNDVGGIGESSEPLDVAKPVRLNGTLRLERYSCAVQRLAPEDVDAEPEPGPVCVLALRGPDEKAHFVTLQPRSAHMVEHMMSGAPLGACIAYACAQMGEEVNDEILAVLAPTLATLQDEHVILGAA